MQRKAYNDLNIWFTQKKRKPLVLRGARQVGKSYLVRSWTKQKKLKLIEINFEKNPEIKELFVSKNTIQIIKYLELQLNEKIDPDNSLIFLDEIQAAPEVFLSLRYFFEDSPQYAIIAAGSLLEFAFTDNEFSVPVGRIEYLFLGPMTFEEFLLAKQQQQILDFLNNWNINSLKSTEASIPLSIHNQLMLMVNEYFVTGGMPEVIDSFISNNSFVNCEKIKTSIIQTYEDDFHKYKKRIPHERLRKILYNLPAQIGEKYKYSKVCKEEKSLVLSQALSLLSLSKVIYKVHHSDCSGIPLHSQIKENTFKCLSLDVGLLSSLAGLKSTELLIAKDLNSVFKGALAEQFIGQHLLYRQPSYKPPELFYWSREKAQSSAEIDYVIEAEGSIIPIEVKSGTSGHLKSLHVFLKEKNLGAGIRFQNTIPNLLSTKALFENDKTLEYKLLTLPFYFIEQVSRLGKELVNTCD